MNEKGSKMLAGMMLIISGVSVRIVHAQGLPMDYHVDMSLRSGSIDYRMISAASTCACRVQCLKEVECTAVTVDTDQSTGVTNCSFTNRTILTPTELNSSSSAITWIKPGVFQKFATTTPATTTSTTVSTTSTTETTTTITTTTPTTTSTTTPTTTSTTPTTTSTTPTTSTTTSIPPTTTPTITQADLVMGASKKIDDGSAGVECWSRGNMLYTAYTTEEFDQVRGVLLANPTTFNKDLLVGFRNWTWTDFLGFTRDPDSSEWTNKDTSKSCAMLKKSNDFKLESIDCTTGKEVLCIKLPGDCLPYRRVVDSVEVAQCAVRFWDHADILCWINGGRIYTAGTVDEMKSVANYWKNTSLSFPGYQQPMWVGVRMGKWNLTGRVTDNAEWTTGSSSSTEQSTDKCAAIEKANNYLLKSDTCTAANRVLCKKQVCMPGYEMIPGIGCSRKVGPSPWAQGSQSPCTDNGGSLYSPANGMQFAFLIQYLNDGSTTFNEDLWISGSWSDARLWVGGVITPVTSGTCVYLKKDSNFLQKADNCTQAKAMLCRIPKPQQL